MKRVTISEALMLSQKGEWRELSDPYDNHKIKPTFCATYIVHFRPGAKTYDPQGPYEFALVGGAR